MFKTPSEIVESYGYLWTVPDSWPCDRSYFWSKKGWQFGGWIQKCPQCNKRTHTSCCACGCGNCYECGYRFSCSPVNSDDWAKILGDGLRNDLLDDSKSLDKLFPVRQVSISGPDLTQLVIDKLELAIKNKEDFLAKQTGFYLQYEDQGHTSIEINTLKKAIEIIKAC